ncbi:MAG: deoxyribonuclease V [Pseudomonadales bacterium]
MKNAPIHRWDLTTKEAKIIQTNLAENVCNIDQLSTVKLIAGTDVGFEANNTITRAAVIILSFPELKLVEYQIAKRPTTFAYIPGYLSFRECPALLDAMEQLQRTPDLILCDGQGIAHPRRFGIACHLGVLTGIPTIGVAKSRLLGKHKEVGIQKGDWQALIDKGETIGAVLRTRDNINPLFISPGHKISLQTSIDYVLRCTTRYRLPETTRWADGIASARPTFIKKLGIKN